MLKIFTEQQFLNSDNRKRVFPLLFDLVYVPNSKTSLNFGFTESIADADIIIFPVDIVSFIKNDRENFFDNWLEEKVKFNKPIWLYAAGDFGFSIEKTNVSTFRLSDFKSKIKPKTFILPGFVSDPYDNILNDFFVISKKSKPTIGFVGNANGSFLKFCKEFILFARRSLINLRSNNVEDYYPFYPSGTKRYKLLRKLQQASQIESSFIFRDKYSARDKNIGTKESTTREFFENIQDNLYVFCLRGNGNFSIRFYETLIMGRIPVLIDTDVCLPFADTIDWKNHCLLVPEDAIVERLLEFHTSKTEEDLKEMQINNRKLMLEKLNRIDYFIEMAAKNFKFK